jgi:hypothetical protein
VKEETSMHETASSDVKVEIPLHEELNTEKDKE